MCRHTTSPVRSSRRTPTADRQSKRPGDWTNRPAAEAEAEAEAAAAAAAEAAAAAAEAAAAAAAAEAEAEAEAARHHRRLRRSAEKWLQ